MANHDPALPSFQTMLPAPASANSSATATTSLNSPPPEHSALANPIPHQHQQQQRPDRPSISPVSPDTAGSSFDPHSPFSPTRLEHVRARYSSTIPASGNVPSGGNFYPHPRHHIKSPLDQPQSQFAPRHSHLSPVMRTGDHPPHIRVATSADRSTVPPSGLSATSLKHTSEAWPIPHQPHHHHHQLHQHDDPSVVAGPISPSPLIPTPTIPHQAVTFSQPKSPVMSVHPQQQQQPSFISHPSIQQQQTRMAAQFASTHYNPGPSPTFTPTMTSPAYPRYDYGNYHQTSSIRSNNYDQTGQHPYHAQPTTPSSAGGPYHPHQQQPHHPQHQDGYRPIHPSRTPSPSRQSSIPGPSSQHDPASLTAQFSYHQQQHPAVDPSLDDSGIQTREYYEIRRPSVDHGYHRADPQQPSPTYGHHTSHHHVSSVSSWDASGQPLHPPNSMMASYITSGRAGLEDVHGGHSAPRTIYMPIPNSSNSNQSHPHSAGSDGSPRWQNTHPHHPHHTHEPQQAYHPYGYDPSSYQQPPMPLPDDPTGALPAPQQVEWSLPSQQNSLPPPPASGETTALDSPILTSPDADSKAGINLGDDSVDMIMSGGSIGDPMTPVNAPSATSSTGPVTISSSSTSKTPVPKASQRSSSPALLGLKKVKHKSRKTWTEAEWKKLVELTERSKRGNPTAEIDWDFVTEGFGGRRCRQGILTVAAKRGLKVSTREARTQSKRGRSSEGSD